MKIRPVGAELFHADRRTGGQMDFTNAPEKENKRHQALHS